MLLSKDDILKAAKLEHEDVNVPGLGGTIRVRVLTVGEYDEYQQALFKWKDGKIEQNFRDMTAALLVHCIVDDKGNKMFTRDEIKKLPAAPVRKLYEVAQKLNGETAEAAEEIEKN